MRQNYETFLATCATHDTAHAYPSSKQCRPYPGHNCVETQRLAASTSGRRSQGWARFYYQWCHRPAGRTRCFLQQDPKRHENASELRNVPSHVCHT
jgi:hypothetical protein